MEDGWENLEKIHRYVYRTFHTIEPNLTTLLRLLQAYIYNNGEYVFVIRYMSLKHLISCIFNITCWHNS